MTQTPEVKLEHLLRDLAPQVLAAVTRKHGDFAAAEDAVQDALIAAAAQWPSEGIPQNPRGWLYHVALRRITDQIRSESSRRKREETVMGDVWAEWAFVPPADAALDAEEDDSLLLLFMCCHPSLTPPSAIALTLRAVGGLTTAEIASAFLVPEATMAQRISRAKSAIKSSKIPFAMPGDAERTERLASVLHVLYLIFTEGYTTSAGKTLHRTDLSNEAIRLTRALRAVRPCEGEIAGLLALMLLTDARRAARTDDSGAIVPLDEQDRTRWNRAWIDEGTALLPTALAIPGPYAVQAAIAAVHSEATSAHATDWPQILELYRVLEQIAPNPMVTLNRAIALAMVEGPGAGLELLATIEDDARLSGRHRLDAVRGHLYERAGDLDRAVAHLRAAADSAENIPERDYLLVKAAMLTARRGA